MTNAFPVITKYIMRQKQLHVASHTSLLVKTCNYQRAHCNEKGESVDMVVQPIMSRLSRECNLGGDICFMIMLVRIEDLQKGDILIVSGSGLS